MVTTASTRTAHDGSATTRDHVIIFPFMAKGHTIPLLHLAGALSRRGLRISLITTPANAPFIHRHLPAACHPLVAVHSLPFTPLPPLPRGVESTDALPSLGLYPAFHRATALLADPFDSLLRRLVHDGSGSTPLCLISDFFLWWTLPPCRELRLPRLVFHGTSAFALVLCGSMGSHRPFDGGSATFHVPGAPPSMLFTQADVPEEIRNLNNPVESSNPFMQEICNADRSSWGVLVNSFAEIDAGHYVELLESSYPPGVCSWLLGPLCLLPAVADDSAAESDQGGCLRWLDEKSPDSVVYVSFGTQAQLSNAQLDELAYGLAESGHVFLLITRSNTWRAPLDVATRGSKVVHGWAPQEAVLRHAAVRGFVSHCGWNSVLDSLAAGVPILAWPMIAEQPLNARHVAEVLGAGVSLGMRHPGEVVGREELAEGVREVMGSGGDRGRRARERARELQRAAAAAVAEGGSSEVALLELLQKLREVRVGGDGVVNGDCKKVVVHDGM